jgi:hypothetical protein
MRMASLRKGRETAIPHYLGGNALQHFLRAVKIEHLQIGVAVEIDETGRDGEIRAIHLPPTLGWLYAADPRDAVAINEHVLADRLRACSIEYKPVP